MSLKLTRPICFFDLETTGTDIAKDRIVEIAILKVFPDEKKELKSWLVNPEMPIPKLVSDIHGITDERVKDKPTFKNIAKDIQNFINKADLAGYNSNRFDIPLLAEEMLRAGINFTKKSFKAVDVQTVFHKMEKRTLSAAFKFYCDKELENAHSAEADTQATYEVLISQLKKYPELENNIDFLEEFTQQKRTVDFAGFIIYNEKNEACVSFGKHKGKSVSSLWKENPAYLKWMLNADFPMYTKKVINEIQLESLNTKQ